MMTDLVMSPAKRSKSPDRKISLLCSIWAAFVLRAGIGAVMVIRFEALGILCPVLPLLAMMIGQSAVQRLDGRRQYSSIFAMAARESSCR
jgi:uncharacterized membrane protein YoaK (UPF0700 family)